MSSDPNAPPLAKHLASTDKKTRDKAIKNLAVFLSDPQRDALPELEMAKLWKGIFYCYWMSDKPLVQQALSSELADLVLAISSTTAALAFLRGFWAAVVREWNGIDRLRMDKYYMLVRKFVNVSFCLLMRAEWSDDACQEYNSTLTCRGGILCPEDIRVPASLSYHICDVYLEELDKVLSSSTDSEDAAEQLPAPLQSLVDPFLHLAARTSSIITHQRIFEALVDPLFTALKSQSHSGAADEGPSRKRARLLGTSAYTHIVENSCLSRPKEEGKMEAGVLRKALLRRMFDVASMPDTRDANRRRMYAVWRSAAAEDEEDEFETAADASSH